jgi:hypothetical protein
MKYFLGATALIFAFVMTHAQWNAPGGELPAYHATAPAKGAVLPAILTEKQLVDAGLTQPAQKASYKAAAKVSSVVYQMPCYCHCDRHAGHTSLRACFESTHGANCGTCMAEAMYSYEKSKKGWTPKMIRDGIIRGEFQQVDLQNPAPVN